MKKTIGISATSPIAIRNFFLTPQSVISQLKKEGMRLVVFVPKDAALQAEKDFADAELVIEPIPVSYRRSSFEQIVTFFTSYLNFTPLQRLEARMGVRIDVPPSGGYLFLYPLKALIAATFGKLKFIRTIVAPRLDLLAYRDRPYRQYFEKYRPVAVFVPDIFEPQGRALLREARRQKVPSVGMILSWDHFPKRFEPMKPDTLLVWNEVNAREAVDLQSYAKEQVHVVGVPQYDFFVHNEFLESREAFCRNAGLDPAKKIIAFFSSSKRAPDDGDIVDIMLKAIENDTLSAPAQIFLRPYPGVSVDREKFKLFEGNPNIYIDWIDIKKVFGNAAHGWYPDKNAMVRIMNIIYHAAVVVNTYSSASIEAAALGRPVININFDGYKTRPFAQSIKRSKFKSHYAHVLETGGVFQAENAEDLVRYLNESLANPDANKENRAILKSRMCWKLDGKASERIAGHILKATEEIEKSV